MARINVQKRLVRSLLMRSVVIAILLLLYTPLITVLIQGLSPQNLLSVFSKKAYYSMLWFSISQAAISTVLALLMGVPLAYILSKYNFFGKKLISMLTLIPFVIPSILIVLGFVLVWGNNGIINQSLIAMLEILGIPHKTPVISLLYSVPAIVIAHAFYNFGICARVLSARWITLPKSQIYAAKNLGASSWRCTKDIVIPHLLPAIKTSAAIVYLFCFTSFAIILILGGGPWHSTLEVAIYRLVNIDFNIGEASSLALIQMSTTVLIGLWFFRGSEHSLRRQTMYMPTKLTESRARFWVRPYVWLLLIMMTLPFLAIIFYSLFTKISLGGGYRLDLMAYISLFKSSNNMNAILFSIYISTFACVISLMISSIMAWLIYKTTSAWQNIVLQLILFLPYFVSPIVLALSYTKVRAVFGTNSLLTLVLVLAILASPLLTRIILTSLYGITTNIVQAAENLGASRRRILYSIYAPLLMPAILISMSLALCLSLGELSASIMLLPRETTTIPIMMYRLLNNYRFLEATRMGVVLIILTALLLLLIDKVGKKFQRRFSFDRVF